MFTDTTTTTGTASSTTRGSVADPDRYGLIPPPGAVTVAPVPRPDAFHRAVAGSQRIGLDLVMALVDGDDARYREHVVAGNLDDRREVTALTDAAIHACCRSCLHTRSLLAAIFGDEAMSLGCEYLEKAIRMWDTGWNVGIGGPSPEQDDASRALQEVAQRDGPHVLAARLRWVIPRLHLPHLTMFALSAIVDEDEGLEDFDEYAEQANPGCAYEPYRPLAVIDQQPGT